MTTRHFMAAVRYPMAAGALYDAAVALPILLAPEPLARVLGLPMPAQEIHLRFLAVFLLILAAFYLLPVIAPGRYLGNVVVAAAGRMMGAAFLIGAVALYGQPRPYLLLGLADLGFGLIHYLSLVPFGGLAIWRVTGMDLSERGTAGRDR